MINQQRFLPLIIDAGSYHTRGGFVAGSPSVSFRTLVGHTQANEVIVGNSVLPIRGLLPTSTPLHDGLITDWSVMESIYQHFFSNIAIPNEQSLPPLIIIEQPYLPCKGNRMKNLEILMEKFRASDVMFANSALLSLYSVSKSSGVVLHMGHESTNIIPIYESAIVRSSCYKIPIGGKHISEFLKMELRDRGLYVDEDIARDIVETECNVVLDYNSPSPVLNNNNRTYELPDGEILDLGELCHLCPELLFRPHLLSVRQRVEMNINDHLPCLIDTLLDCVQSCDQMIQEKIFLNVVLSGGTSMIKGVPVRLLTDVDERKVHDNFRVKAEPERQDAPFLGACIVSSLFMDDKNLWITNNDYEEHGPRIAYCKGMLT